MIGRLAWVSARAARGTDEDEPLALAALARTGAHVEVVCWDEEADWASFDRAVLRSTWDYAERPEEFAAWLARVGTETELVNPRPLVRWNSDKSYLAELGAAGIPVIPTLSVPPGEGVDALPTHSGGVVVKPSVGAGSIGVRAFAPAEIDAARAHVAHLHARGRTALVQPRLASVPTRGEWPMVFLGGTFSHAANKRVTLPPPGATDLFATEASAPHSPTEAQLAVASAVVDLVTQRFGRPAYARVDLVAADDGAPLVLEVELIEPSLFLPCASPDAAARLAEVLTSR